METAVAEWEACCRRVETAQSRYVAGGDYMIWKSVVVET